MKRRVDLPLPMFIFAVVTRGLLGVGVGLLAAEKLRRPGRRRLARALLAVGAATTVPAAWAVYRSMRPGVGRKISEVA
jgi:hypothetical protein